MNAVRVVLKHQWRMALKDSGTLVFYACGAVLIGGLLPFLPGASLFVLNAAVLYPLFLLKLWSADSLAAEKEAGTLESLLSSPVLKRQLLLGKGLFCLSASSACFGLIMALLALVKGLAGAAASLSLPMLLAGTVLFAASALCLTLTGLYASALAEEPEEAGSRGMRFFIPVILCLLVLLTLVNGRQTLAVCLLGGLFLIVVLAVGAYALCRLRKMERGRLLAAERVKIPGQRRRSGRNHRHQVWVVFGHEWRYFRALGRFKISLALFTLAPAITLWALAYYFGGLNVYMALAVLGLGTARLTVNLTAYTIGGERAYKTFESLLSTPVHTGALFLGKGLLAVVFTAGISLLSGVLMFLTAALIGGGDKSLALSVFTTADQWLLLGCVLLFSLLMVYATGFTSMMLKKPRQGLYASTLLSFLAALPPVAVWLFPGNPTVWALSCLLLLLAADLVLAWIVHKKVSRNQLMNCI